MLNRSRRARKALAAMFCLLWILTACSSNDDDNGGGGGGSGACGEGIPAASQSEPEYCTGVSLGAGSGALTVTGTARYEYREATSSGLSGGTLPTRKIRHAEVRVLNSSGSVVRCVETDDNGDFTFNVPNDGQAYTVMVSARAKNSHANVSVMNTPDKNVPYTVNKSVTASGTSPKSMGTLTAEGRNTVVGGAFNIYDQIVKAQEFLKTETSSNCAGVNGPHRNCATYNPLTDPSGGTAKASVYWKKGFNPNEYFVCDSSGLSFYLPQTNQLYILGGVDDDVDNEDTDHFDNSVIVHEFAHFLEDQYAASDSPGGSHNGNSIIDPRLAWSEGWANFFQAAALGTPLYQDTIGNADGSTANAFFMDLEFRCQNNSTDEKGNDSGTGISCSDFPSALGEGNFREFAITRGLWDVIDEGTGVADGQDKFNANADTDDFFIPFAEVWTGFLNLKDSDLVFRAVGLFHELMRQLTGTATLAGKLADYNDLITLGERHQPNRADYVNPTELVATGANCGANAFSNEFPSSGQNLFRAFDYYDIDHPGGSLALNLTYDGQPDSSRAATADLDLYLYNASHTLFSSSSIVASSNQVATEDGDTEEISLSSLQAGRYMILVHYFEGPTNARYTLTVNHSGTGGTKKICPETTFP